MAETPIATITTHFSSLEDPRRVNRRHLLLDIIVIAICAAICGADDWVAVANYGHAKKAWLGSVDIWGTMAPCQPSRYQMNNGPRF
jgi:hypothetical protein